jgi:hypothetical protein
MQVTECWSGNWAASPSWLTGAGATSLHTIKRKNDRMIVGYGYEITTVKRVSASFSLTTPLQ